MKSGKRTKSGRRSLMIAGIAVVAVLLVLVLFLLLFQLRGIEVTGNTYVSQDEVAEWVQEDRYATNSLYLWAKYKFTDPTLYPALDGVEVNLKNPWTISVRVYEKKMVGFVYDETNYVYFDGEGMVLAIDMEFRDGVPFIEGLTVSGAVLYETMPVEEASVFEVILEATQVLEKNEIATDRIVIKDSELYLYFSSVCARLGNTNLENRIIQIPPILEKLEDKKGTLHLENYQNSDSYISFDENVWPDEAQNEAQSEEN